MWKGKSTTHFCYGAAMGFVGFTRFVHQADMCRESWFVLKGGLEPLIFLTFHILGISSSQLTKSIIFQRGMYTTNQSKILKDTHVEFLVARIASVVVCPWWMVDKQLLPSGPIKTITISPINIRSDGEDGKESSTHALFLYEYDDGPEQMRPVCLAWNKQINTDSLRRISRFSSLRKFGKLFQ